MQCAPHFFLGGKLTKIQYLLSLITPTTAATTAAPQVIIIGTTSAAQAFVNGLTQAQLQVLAAAFLTGWKHIKFFNNKLVY